MLEPRFMCIGTVFELSAIQSDTGPGKNPHARSITIRILAQKSVAHSNG